MAERHVDVLIVGAGIAGLLLARELRSRGRRVALAHDPARPGAGEAAVGLLNPVRGRRCTLAWRATETFAAAREVYGAIAAGGSGPVMRELPVVRAFASAEERSCFERRAGAIAKAGFVVRALAATPAGWRDAGHGVVEVDGGGALDTRALTERLRAEMRAADVLVERRCPATDLVLGPTAVAWTAARVQAARIVLCGGADDLASSLAGPLPLRPVRGESLLVRVPGLQPDAAFVCGHHLAPVAPGLWSCGGTKAPGDALSRTTPEGRAELVDFLERHVRVPWEITGHWCGVRAATLDTRPLAGPAGDDPRVVVFNGLGSQGFSVAPWLARRLADHLAGDQELPAELNPARFAPRPRPSGTERWDAIDDAHELALRSLAPGDLAIDLTTGNGGDTLRLAEAVGADGAILGLDVQPEAIAATHRRLAHAECEATVELRCDDHARIDALVAPHWRGQVGAIVATLGHLPGSTSPVITRPESTIAAFSAALPLLRPGGVLVAVINPQHPDGAAELAAIERWARELDATTYTVEWRRGPGGSSRAPAVVSARRIGR